VLDSLDDVPISQVLSILKTGQDGKTEPILQTCGGLVDKDERYSGKFIIEIMRNYERW